MRTLFRSVGLAAIAASLAMTTAPAFAGTTFDLGIDVSGVARTASAVDSYIASLEPETQAAIMGACDNYVQNPTSARDVSTLGFCQIAVGAGNTTTFASSRSPVVLGAPAVSRAPADTPRLSAGGGTGGYTLCFNGSPDYPTC
jgi:hypothetical protein